MILEKKIVNEHCTKYVYPFERKSQFKRYEW